MPVWIEEITTRLTIYKKVTNRLHCRTNYQGYHFKSKQLHRNCFRLHLNAKFDRGNSYALTCLPIAHGRIIDNNFKVKKVVVRSSEGR